MNRKITLGIAHALDFDGLYFTLNHLRVFHPQFLEQCEVLLVDNEREGYSSWGMKLLANKLNKFVPTKYVCYLGNTGQAYVKQVIIENAQTEWVFICDSHIIFLPGALDNLLNYLDLSEEREIITGVRYDETLTPICTHLEPDWNISTYGLPAFNEDAFKENKPFTVTLAELHAFACRKTTWPGIPRRFRGAIHEEVYVYEKLKEMGGKGICLPSFGYIHQGIKVFPPNKNQSDLVRNYLLIWRELGKDEEEIKRRFFDRLSEDARDKISSQTEEEQKKPCGCSDKLNPSDQVTEEEELRLKLKTHRIDTTAELIDPNVCSICKVLDSSEEWIKKAQKISVVSSSPLFIHAWLYRFHPDASITSFVSDHKVIEELVILREYALRDPNTSPIYLSLPTVIKNSDLILIHLEAPIVEKLNEIFAACIKGRCNRIILLGGLDNQEKIDIVARLLLNYPDYSVISVVKEQPGAYLISSIPEDKPELPSLAQMAINFIQAVAKHVVTGANMVDKETLEKRLMVCSVCEHRVDDRCSICGCFLISENSKMGKALWKDQICPLRKWT